MKHKFSIILIPFLLAGCNSSVKKDPIMIIAPMESEHNVIYDTLVNKKDEVHGNYHFTKGYIDNYPIVLARSMVGMVNAATATTIGIEYYQPKSIIVQGTAGAHNPNLHKGDIVLGKDIIQNNSYVTGHKDEGAGYSLDNRENVGQEMVVDNQIEEIATLHSTQYLLDIAQNTNYDGKLVQGTISTGDPWNREIDVIKYYYETLHSDCEEMEGFAVGQVAHQYNIDFLCIRIISNSEYYPNEIFTEDAAKICQNYSINVVKNIIKNL